MTNEQIKQAANKLRKEFEGKYGVGSNLRFQDVAVWIEQTFIEGVQFSQSEIDELVEILRDTFREKKSVIDVFTTQDRAKKLLKKYEKWE